MWKYLKGYRAEAAAAPFMKLGEALLELYVPLYVAKVINDGIAGNDSSAVIKNCLVIAAFGLAGLILSCISQWFSARASVGYASALRADLYAKVVKISRSDTDKIGRSALITRLTADTDKIQNGINMGLRLLLRSPFVVFGSVIMAMTVNLTAGLYFLAAVGILTVIVFAIILSGIPLQGKASRKLEKITGKVRDNIRGIRVIRAFGREDEETRSFDVCNRENAEATVRAGRVSSLMNPLTFAVINIAIIIVVKFSSVRVSAGEMKPGDVVALYNYMGQVLIELVKLANLTLTISRAVSCAGRIKKVLELPDETGCEPVAEGVHTDEVLSFNNVCFRYPGASEDSVSDISFSLKRGESLGILGGTGSGKSTVANLIPGLYKPTKGNITVCGQDTSLVNPEAVRSHVSMVPQSSRLFSGTVADNIRRGNPDADESAVRRALSLACALDFSEEKENGINTEVLSGGSNFSGGQKQRLTIARALIANPDILVLDDCLSALDFRTDLKVRQNIAGLDPKPATVIISQRPSTVLNCDRILVLEDGKCAGYGTADELYESCPLYREIYDSQYSGREAEE